MAGSETRRRQILEAMVQVVGREGSRCDPEQPWLERMRSGLATVVELFALDPGRAERLPELLPDLLFAMLVPYIGPGAATVEMRRAAAG